MFANPLGLLALLAVPAIVALHLFRRRFRPHEVSALFLWGDEDRTPTSGRRRDRLRSSVSLFSECLAALFLALLLAGPRGCASGQGVHLVVVLDGSASMDARGNGDGTARERGAALVRERIEELPRGSRVSLVQSGPRPRTLAGPAAYPEEALDAVGAWRPTAARHDLAPALALGLQLAGAGRVLCVTDRFAPDEVPAEVEIAALGTPLDNVSIAAATRTAARIDGARRERVFVTVASHADAPRATRVRLLDTDGRELIDPREVTLAPLEREHLAFDLPPGAPAIEVRLDPDALDIDGRAWLAPRPPRIVGLACDLDEETRAVLGIDGPDGTPLLRWSALVEETVPATPDAAHVLLSRAAGGGPATWCLVLQPAAGAGERRDFIGPFLAERRHPLLEGLTLEGIVWSADPALQLAGTPLVSAGNLPLLAEEAGPARRVYTLDLDPRRSSLQRSPDWPILLANLVEERRAELPGAVATNFAVGGALVWRTALGADDDGAPFVLRGPGPAREHPARSVVVFDEVDEPGIHVLERRGAVLCTIGVTFQDAAESDLRGLSAGRRPSSAEAAPGGAGGSSLELALLAGILLLALVDWIVLARAAPATADLPPGGP